MKHTRMLCLTALFAALTAAGAFVRLPFGVLPVTLQFFITALAGLLLGPRWGALSQGVYVALGLVGLPIFTMGGGPGYVLQPSFGFLLGLIPAAWAVGRLGERRPLTAARAALASLVGLALLYLVGLPWLALICNLYLGRGMTIAQVLTGGMLVYLPGDALKIAAVAALAPALTRRLPS